jgi:hypothetical protein
MGLRVKDVEESERRAVMVRIGVTACQHHPARKGADFRRVSRRERMCRTLRGGQANVGHNNDWCGLPRSPGLESD